MEGIWKRGSKFPASEGDEIENKEYIKHKVCSFSLSVGVETRMEGLGASKRG